LPWLLNWLGAFYSYRVIPLLEYNLGATFATIVQNAFYEQWAYGTILGASALPTGFLSQLNASFAGAPYFEIGIPTPTTLSLGEVAALWDETNNYTFVHTDGILVWLAAMLNDTDSQTALLTAFGSAGLTVAELPGLLTWLGNFYTVRIPQLIEYDTGYTVPELAQLSFYEQWANGTIQGEALLPDGFLAELGLTGTPYFEVGLPTETNMSLSVVEDLWDDTSDYTFVGGGIELWGEAATNTTVQALLISELGLSATELLTLLVWLGDFVETRVPQLIEIDTGLTVPELAQVLFYEQWANGTIYGDAFLPDGFLSLRDPPLYGPPYFEVGLTEGATEMTVEQCDKLWDENSTYSLVNVNGINKWYQAKEGNEMYDILQGIFDLTDDQMDAILSWLPKFRNIIVNKLGKDEYNLPLEPENLGNTIFLGGAIGGGALAALGVVLAILSKRKI